MGAPVPQTEYKRVSDLVEWCPSVRDVVDDMLTGISRYLTMNNVDPQDIEVESVWQSRADGATVFINITRKR